MPEKPSIRLKVPAYIKKYMLAQSVNNAEPMIFPRKHIYNISLVKKTSNYNYLKQLPITEKENVYEHFYNVKRQLPSFRYVTITLPYNEVKDPFTYNYFSRKSKNLFLKEVKDDFYFELTRYIIRRMRQNIPRKEAIIEFLNFYKITEDDVKLETIYRQTSRILKPFL